MAFDGASSINNIVGIMQAKYGMSPGAAANLFAQLNHESARGTSRLAQENHNFGGLTQSTPNGEDNKQPDGSNYYRVFNSDEEYADAMYNDFFKYYPEIMKASDPYQYAHILKQNGYYGAPESDYANAIASIAKEYNPNAINTSWAPTSGNGQPMFSANMKLNMNDPSEPLDIAGLMSALQIPKQNVAAAGDRALRDELLRQAQHMGMGIHQAEFFQNSDAALMKSAIAKAQEDAKFANEQATLTGAGKVAKMIAESHNSSNAKAYATLASMMGIKVDPMADRYVDQNQLVLQNIAQQQKQYAANQDFARRKELADLDYARKKDLMKYQSDLQFDQAMRMANAGIGKSSGGSVSRGSSGSNGGQSASSVIAQQKYINDLYAKYQEELQGLSDSIDANGISDDSGAKAGNLIKNYMMQLNDLPDSTAKLKAMNDMKNDFDYFKGVLTERKPGIWFGGM